MLGAYGTGIAGMPQQGAVECQYGYSTTSPPWSRRQFFSAGDLVHARFGYSLAVSRQSKSTLIQFHMSALCESVIDSVVQ